MLTIGLLGGIGPQATMDFEARIHAVAQRLLPPDGNAGYPPLVVIYLRHPPVRVGKDRRPLQPLQVDPRLLEGAARLGTCCDFVVISSNTPHTFVDEIAAAAGLPVLDMVELAVQEALRRGSQPVGLLGMGPPRVYEVPLDRAAMAYKTPPLALRHRLDAAILALMEGRASDEDRQAARDAVANLRGRGCPITILGCTELPLLLGPDAEAEDLIDPATLLAEAAVRRSIG